MKNYKEIEDYKNDLIERHGNDKASIIKEIKSHYDFAYIDVKTIIRSTVECIYFYCETAPKRVALLMSFDITKK